MIAGIVQGEDRNADSSLPATRYFFQIVAVLTIQHRPAGGGEVLAERVGGGEVLRLFCGPAFLGEGGDLGGHLDGRRGRPVEAETEGEHDLIESGEIARECRALLVGVDDAEKGA